MHLFIIEYDWHLIYYSTNDIDKKTNNHWKHGTHIHLINHLWGDINLQAIWDNFPKFPKKGVHIKYTDD